jgi:ABC-type antimicrobial peptide transport system permease subunit
MLVRSFLELQGADPGFDGSSLVTGRVRVPPSKYPDDEERMVFLEQLVEKARGVEGTGAVALVNVLPQNVQTPTDTFRVQGRERDPTAAAPRAFSLKASPGYTEVFGIEVLQGRFFEEGDRLGQPPVAVVNRSFVETWFGTESPVGQYIHFEGELRQVVGVVSDVQQVMFRTAGSVESEAIYVPVAQDPMGTYTLVATASGDPAELKEPLRASLQELDPDLTLSQVLTMDEFVEQFFVGIQVFNTILGGFGILAILLASMGTYGVLAYQVGQRRHEIGIRMAVLGLALGGLALVPLTQLLRSILSGFADVRSDTGFAVAGILFLVTLLASLVPAYRASTLNPVQALRDE